jgi:outer membrane immunogenic protein
VLDSHSFLGVLLKKLACAIAVIASIGTPAFAADMAVKMPVKAPAPAPAPVYNWTGFYVGGDLGGRWDRDSGTVTSAFIGTPPVSALNGASGSTLSSSSFRGGVFAGWNWQFSPQGLVGIEGDWNWANNSNTQNGSPYPSPLAFGTPAFPGPFPLAGSFSDKQTWDSSIRLRAGVLATPTFLVFATGGASWIHLEATSNCSTVPAPGVASNCSANNFFNGTLGPVSISQSDTRIGWTIGGGAEWMLASNWLVRAEYRYSDYGTANFTDLRFCTGCTFPGQANPLSISYSQRITTQTATVGLAYKF